MKRSFTPDRPGGPPEKEETNMKRLLSILALCALALALTACGIDQGTASGSASSGAADGISFDAVY